jgi:ribonuclease Z
VDLDLVFLGTSGSLPTAQRAPSALLIRRGSERLLFDCGEGTQRQMLRSTVGLVELREVFLTHYHADHYLGLPGMLKTFALRGRELDLTVYGPPGLVELFGALRRIFGRLTYKLRLEELQPGDVLDRDGYRLVTFSPAHGVSALGYALVEGPRPGRFDVAAADALGVEPPQRGLLQRGESIELPDGRVVTPDEVLGPARPGRKLVLAGDTAPSATVLEAARGAEVLVHEATFLEEERERARETAHSTAVDAAEIAREAAVSLLALTHPSNRYFGPEVAREARTIFPETVVPKDLDVVDVPFPERGKPRLLKGAAKPPARTAAAEPAKPELSPERALDRKPEAEAVS